MEYDLVWHAFDGRVRRAIKRIGTMFKAVHAIEAKYTPEDYG